MPIDVYWDNDGKTIIRQDFVGNWTKDNYFAAIDKSYEMSETVNHPVDTIIDMRNNTTNPIQLMNIFSTANKLETHVSSNQRAVVIVGANVTIEFALRMAKRIAKRAAENSHTARTLEEAYDIIAKQ